MNKRIQVFNRHCKFSSVSQYKERPSWFSRENCHANLLGTINWDLCDLNIFFDGVIPGNHFINKNCLSHNSVIAELPGGTEAASFSSLVKFISEQDFEDDTIIYIVEDDYLHVKDWSETLLEGFDLFKGDKSYITLYDHKDKYFFPQYVGLFSKIFASKTCHWRTTPSTTNTFATTFKQLKEDLDIHIRYSTGVSITRDHEKFLHLGEMGRNLYSSIPGFSTHCEPAYLSPVTDWETWNL